MTNYIFDRGNHNVDIMASTDTVFCLTNLIPNEDDLITVNVGEMTATVKAVTARCINNYPKHNVAIDVKGAESELAKLREMLTYKVE